MIDPRKHPSRLMLPPVPVTDVEIDRLSREIDREKVGGSLSVRLDLVELALDKRLRQPAPRKASSAPRPVDKTPFPRPKPATYTGDG